MPSLNADSPIPLYRQLATVLLARIRDGEYWYDRPAIPTGALSAFGRVAGVVWNEVLRMTKH